MESACSSDGDLYVMYGKRSPLHPGKWRTHCWRVVSVLALACGLVPLSAGSGSARSHRPVRSGDPVVLGRRDTAPPPAHRGTAIATPTPLGNDQCVVPPAIMADVVGDYGVCTMSSTACLRELMVARAISLQSPQLGVAVGDLNMVHGEAGPSCRPPPVGCLPAHIRQNNERVYRSADFPACNQAGFPPVTPYPTGGVPLYQDFLTRGVFYATWGNHGWRTSGAQPAKQYFGANPVYAIRAGLVDFIAVDSSVVFWPRCTGGGQGFGQSRGLGSNILA